MSIKFASSAFALCFLACGLDSTPILAATPATSLAVTATVQAGCLISAPAIPLGGYPAAVESAKPEFSVTCTNPTAYIVEVSPGSNSSATLPTRRITGLVWSSPGYARGSDSQGIVHWGEIVGIQKPAAWRNTSARTLSVPTQLVAKQQIAARAYSDIFVLTVTY